LTIQDVRAGRLAAFLGRRQTTEEWLRGQVEESYGPPLLVVATGSVLEGFGNDCSDIDLSVVVDRDSLTQLPIMSYEGESRVDASYYRAADVATWIVTLRDSSWPPLAILTRDAWLRRFNVMKAAVRFAESLVLFASEGWAEWVAELGNPWLKDGVAAWWRAEALRLWLTARWLSDGKPLLASQRACEAVLAGLESGAAGRGQPYLTSNSRWLPEKLRALDDHAGFELLRRIFRTPVRADDCGPYLAACEELLRERLGALETQALRAQLWYASGVSVHDLDSRVLVSRWGLRAVELRGEALPSPDRLEPLWEGPVGAVPPAHVWRLFQEDMTWLGLVARDG
jgi:hypothetical protein